MLSAIKEFIPDLFPYAHSTYSSPSLLLWDNDEIISAEGVQQGDPVGPLFFCLTIHRLISKLKAEFVVFYLDDGTIGGCLDDVSNDLKLIEEEGKDLGLQLNMNKSELISQYEDSLRTTLSTFPGLHFVPANNATLLGSPLGDTDSINQCLESKICQLKLISKRLCYLESHDAITLLRHSFSIPKLLHILRTCPAFLSPSLQSFDEVLMSTLSQVLNIHFNLEDPTWLQATLPVSSGGLGIRSASHLAPSAFLASADGASSLIHQILPSYSNSNYLERESSLLSWRESLPSSTPEPDPPFSHLQKSWDKVRVQARLDSLLSNCKDDQSRARLLAASSKESGAWLHAMPVSSLGLRMSNETVRIAVCLRLGASVCQPHQCIRCSSDVDHLGTHGLSCRHSQGRLFRHNNLNEIIHRSLSAAKIPARLEPSHIIRSNGKRPDGITMTPWSHGQPLVWDVTCTDTLCSSNLHRSTSEPGAAAAYAESLKMVKYANLTPTHHFVPVGVETCGTFGPQALSLFRELGQHLKKATGEQRSYQFLIQRVSVAIQTGNAISILGTLDQPSRTSEDFFFL